MDNISDTDLRRRTLNYSPQVQQVLGFAHQEADRLGHHYVGTEHLLLGLLRLDQGPAPTLLQRHGLTLDTVRGELSQTRLPAPKRDVIRALPLTPEVKRAFAAATREAYRLEHSLVRAEHILLGLLAGEQGGAGQMFKKFGVDVSQAQEGILGQLNAPAPT